MVINSKLIKECEIIKITHSTFPKVKEGKCYFVNSMFFSEIDEVLQQVWLQEVGEDNQPKGQQIKYICDGKVEWEVVGYYTLEVVKIFNYLNIKYEQASKN